MLLGPTESLVIADETADPARLAADLLIEAEHGTDSSVVLITTSTSLADATDAELASRLADLPDVRATAARASLGTNGGCVVVDVARRGGRRSPTGTRRSICRSPSTTPTSIGSSTGYRTPARSSSASTPRSAPPTS